MSRAAGFTLIEMLVAMMIFGVLSVLGYQAINSVLEVQHRNAVALDRQLQLQRLWTVLLNDIVHLRARPVRDELGAVERAYLAPAPGKLANTGRPPRENTTS